MLYIVRMNGCSPEPLDKVGIRKPGIDEYTLANNSLIYPNPNIGGFTVSVPRQTTKIRICSIDCSLLQELPDPDSIESVKCAVSDSGIYLLRIIVKHKEITRKVVVRRD